MPYEDAPPILKDFLNYTSVIKNKSKGTVHEYYYDLRTFFRYLKTKRSDQYADIEFEKIPIDDIDESFIKSIDLSEIYDYLSFVNRNRDNEAAARARKVASLKSFFKYLTNKAEILDTDPTLKLDTPKLKKAQPTYLTLEEAKKLLSVVEGEYRERDLCILTLFLNCGIRLSELIGINLSDIKEDKIKILGKGNKERTVYLNHACNIAIANYLRVRPVDSVYPPDKDALFISRNHRRISERTVQSIVKKYVRLAGLDETKYSPHKLRHTAATLMYKYGEVDIRILQEILGHENLSTTQIYTHLDENQIREAVNKNPLG